jgi:hypothetical protein
MNKQNSIPEKDADFDVSQEIVATTANQKKTAWGLDATWLSSEFMPQKAIWDAAWAAYKDPAKRTPVIVLTKNEARKSYEKRVRVLVKNLQSNVNVRPEDLKAMGIADLNVPHTPSPVATTYPDFDIDSGTIRRLSIHFYDQGNKKSKAKPHGQHGAEICWIISDTPIVDMAELTNSVFDTHTPFTLDFEGHERGKTVYFCLRWENTRGEKGPWSEIQSAIVP